MLRHTRLLWYALLCYVVVPVQCNAMQCYTMQRNARQYTAMLCHAMPLYAVRRCAMLRYALKMIVFLCFDMPEMALRWPQEASRWSKITPRYFKILSSGPLAQKQKLDKTMCGLAVAKWFEWMFVEFSLGILGRSLPMLLPSWVRLRAILGLSKPQEIYHFEAPPTIITVLRL